MARKRLSSVAIEKLEQAVGNSTSKPESAVFGIVNKLLADGTPNVIKRLKMTSTGVSETNEEPTILIPERMELLLYPRRFKVFYGGRGAERRLTLFLTSSKRQDSVTVASDAFVRYRTQSKNQAMPNWLMR